MSLTQHVVILVIEDDPFIRELLSDTLSEQGYAVVAVARGDEALIVLETLRPALITLDLNLPGVPGRLILHELRQHGATQTLPVIAISAQTIPPEVQTQAQASISKPFALDTFLTIVHQLVPLPAVAHTSSNPTTYTTRSLPQTAQHQIAPAHT